MKSIYYSVLPIILIVGLWACNNLEPSQETGKQTTKLYGITSPYRDSIRVDVDLHEFADFSELLRHTEQIVCEGGRPVFAIKSDTLMKLIYLENACWEDFGCILIRHKNVIEIHNDSLRKPLGEYYPFDRMEWFLQRDIENYGLDHKLSESPESLHFFISCDQKGMKNLSLVLDKLTQVYEKIRQNTDIKIWLQKRFI